MPRKRHTAEQIIRKLREAEVELAKARILNSLLARRPHERGAIDGVPTLKVQCG